MTGHALMLLSNPYTHDARVRREVRTLVAAGWRVTVVAWDRKRDQVGEEEMDGARILRVRGGPLMQARRRDLLRLGPWNRLAARTACRLFEVDRFDIVHAHDLDTLPAALSVKRRVGRPVLYDAHEVWGYMIAKDLPRPFVRYYLGKERRLLRHVDHVVTVSDAVRGHLAPHTSAPVDLVMNAKEPQTETYQAPKSGSALRAVYIGVLNPTRLVLELIEAFGGAPRASLWLAGYGPRRYVRQVAAAASVAPNVTFAGLVAHEEVLPRTFEADLVVCLFDPHDPLTRIGMPNKVFEAMACGRATIASAGTHLGDFVQAHDIGLAVEPQPGAIRDALRRLAADPAGRERMGRRALELARGPYGWAAQARTLLDAYEHLSGPRPEGRGRNGP